MAAGVDLAGAAPEVLNVEAETPETRALYGIGEKETEEFGKQLLLARRMARNWERFGLGMPDAIVPVPLHWLRELSRGYNQAELLARPLAATW